MSNFILAPVVFVIISLSAAAPVSEDGKAIIRTSENENDGLGNYKFSFETSNGILRRESGQLVNVGEPNEHLEVQGTYLYTDPEGKFIVVHYSADENGYHIHLPPVDMYGENYNAPLSPHVIATMLRAGK